MENKEIVIEGIQNGLSKNEILTKLIRAGLEMVEANVFYKDVGAESGLLLSAEQKDEKIATILPECVVEGILDRKKAYSALLTDVRMGKGPALKRIKTYAAEHNLQLSKAVHPKRDTSAIESAVKAWHDGGESKEVIEASLIQHFGYTEKNAGKAYNKFGKLIGFITTKATGRVELAKWFNQPSNVEGDKSAIIDRLMSSTGIAKATAETRYGMYLFAVEYAAQGNEPLAEAA